MKKEFVMTHAPSFAQTFLAARKTFAFATASCLLACSAMASDATEDKPAAAPSYTVTQSTPIDKVIQTVYANSPLSTSVLRKVLAEANPKVISGNPQQRVKAGTTLAVPDHAQVVKNILAPHMAAAAETQDSGPLARDLPARRQWVRFP